MNFNRSRSQSSITQNSRTQNSITRNLRIQNSPNIETRYMLISRPNSNIFKPRVYRKKISSSFNENWLQKNDVILDDVKSEKNINEHSLLYDVYSYVHEDLKIPLEDIADIEILFIENKKIINRYPRKNQEIDFKQTILGNLENTSISYASVKKNNFDILVLLLKNNLPLNERTISPIVRKFDIIRSARNIPTNTNRNLLDRVAINIANHAMGNFMNMFNGDWVENENKVWVEYKDGAENENKEMKNYIFTRSFSSFDLSPLFDMKESKRILIPENKIHSLLDEFKFDINNPSRNIKNQITCSICYSEFKKYDDVCFIKKCNHLFHTECIKKWLTQYGNTCPICKCDVKN